MVRHDQASCGEEKDKEDAEVGHAATEDEMGLRRWSRKHLFYRLEEMCLISLLLCFSHDMSYVISQ